MTNPLQRLRYKFNYLKTYIDLRRLGYNKEKAKRLAKILTNNTWKDL